MRLLPHTPKSTRRLSWMAPARLRLKDQKSLDQRKGVVECVYAPTTRLYKHIVTRFKILYFTRFAHPAPTCEVYDFHLNRCATLKFTDDVTQMEVSDDGLVHHGESGEFEHGDKRDGWFFGVTQHCAGKDGKRTGDPRDVKVYFRTVGDLEEQEGKSSM
ncbi:hypothetical protein HK097_009688 [Rhizophlyctis rosea]|uniref:Uncharacterized protein n=1 Tax=Rhizophlyctis rosea TaxID=64517 RepID=A0AAD5SA73_9FUNG|nr:hypothetical protein HK097_009688 [Rhizophlyctis rosea]